MCSPTSAECSTITMPKSHLSSTQVADSTMLFCQELVRVLTSQSPIDCRLASLARLALPGISYVSISVAHQDDLLVLAAGLKGPHRNGQPTRSLVPVRKTAAGLALQEEHYNTSSYRPCRTNHLDLLDARHASMCSSLLCVPIPGIINAPLMSADADAPQAAKGVVAFGLPGSIPISERPRLLAHAQAVAEGLVPLMSNFMELVLSTVAPFVVPKQRRSYSANLDRSLSSPPRLDARFLRSCSLGDADLPIGLLVNDACGTSSVVYCSEAAKSRLQEAEATEKAMTESGHNTKKGAAMHLMHMSAGLQFKDRAIEADFCQYMGGILSQMDAAWMLSYISKSVHQLLSRGSALPTLAAMQAMTVLLVSGSILLAKVLRPAWYQQRREILTRMLVATVVIMALMRPIPPPPVISTGAYPLMWIWQACRIHTLLMAHMCYAVRLKLLLPTMLVTLLASSVRLPQTCSMAVWDGPQSSCILLSFASMYMVAFFVPILIWYLLERRARQGFLRYMHSTRRRV